MSTVTLPHPDLTLRNDLIALLKEVHNAPRYGFTLATKSTDIIARLPAYNIRVDDWRYIDACLTYTVFLGNMHAVKHPDMTKMVKSAIWRCTRWDTCMAARLSGNNQDTDNLGNLAK